MLKKFSIDKKINKKIVYCITILLWIIEIVLVFLLFSFLRSSYIEQYAKDLADFSATKKEDACLKISSKDSEMSSSKYGERIIKNNSLYYDKNFFQEAIISNSEKNEEVFIEELDFLGSPTILCSSIFSDHIDTFHKIIFDQYYLEMMFDVNDFSFGGFDNFLCIFQKDADHLIDNSNGIYKSYSDLLGKQITFNAFGKRYKWIIRNIILDTTGFSESFLNIFGFSILTYSAIPDSLPMSLIKCFHTNPYINFNLLNRTIDDFDKNNFNFQFINIEHQELTDLLNNSFVISDKVYLIGSLIILFFIAIMVFISSMRLNDKLLIYLLSTSLIIFYLWKAFICIFSFSPRLFSFHACATQFLAFIFLLFLYIFKRVWRHVKHDF